MVAGAHLPALVLWGGFALAFAFGAVAQYTNFCTMGAVSDVVNMGHWGRMRMWLLAMAVAVLGTTALATAGLVDLSRTIYQRPTLPWASLLVGGALFGIGMTLAGGCANKNLVRAGGGSVRSLVVLFFLAISAFMTLKGLFGQWRASVLDPLAIDLAALGWHDQSLPTALARAGGLAPKAALPAAAGAFALALLAFVFKDRRFRRNATQVAGGALIGLLVVAGWYLTGHLGWGENPDTLETMSLGTQSHAPESMSFVGPAAYALELLLLWTDRSLHPTFGIALVAGVLLGSLACAVLTRRFRWEGFASLADLRNQLTGAVLMGFGGVTALGCTIGQGLSGISTLALGSLLATAGIVGGAFATLKLIDWREQRGGLGVAVAG
ncbi:MAG TPA: YeeE/YedE family protein [Ideonella sp.]|nr:YeeE/YedE family protein [Ideonella sp.]